ncbi:MAG: peptide ABC transporter substrate-binding protein [Planctomycetes bacterium]|nr:peptide ABC transporter substrate-binding protein [Planctomycetota bacterium]MCP4770700.1 peptide ABC transporter substrate-binding protein [Planctomycetota bacterium]MCP4861415.1 peptide ABC transporter substrate-binding protein [Planctomycetota bacterium]
MANLRWLTLLLLFAACSPSRAELVIANGPDVEVLDPQLANTTAAARVFQALFEGLTRLDPVTLEVLPGLADDWQSNESATNWRFHLREGLQWSDGTPLTLDDVRESWQRLADPATGASYADWMRDTRIETYHDNGWVVVYFTRPMPLFDRMCAYHALTPIPKALREAAPGSLPDPLPSSGPYRLLERRIRDRIRVERNPFSWRADSVGLETIDFRTIDSQFTALNLFLTDEVLYTPNVPSLAVPELLAEHADIYTPAPQFATYFLRFNASKPPFNNQDLRLALSHAIDREALAKQAGGGRPAAATLVPGLVEGYEQVAAPSFDAEQARAYFQKAKDAMGGSIGRLEYIYPSSELNRAVAEVLQQQWREVLGVDVALVNLENQSFRPLQRGLEYQVSHSSWIGDYLDPLTFLELFHTQSSNNRTGYSDTSYDSLLDEATARPIASERFELLAQAETMLLQQAVVLPLLLDISQELASPRLQGFHRNAAGVIDWAALRITSEDGSE